MILALMTFRYQELQHSHEDGDPAEYLVHVHDFNTHIKSVMTYWSLNGFNIAILSPSVHEMLAGPF